MSKSLRRGLDGVSVGVLETCEYELGEIIDSFDIIQREFERSGVPAPVQTEVETLLDRADTLHTAVTQRRAMEAQRSRLDESYPADERLTSFWGVHRGVEEGDEVTLVYDSSYSHKLKERDVTVESNGTMSIRFSHADGEEYILYGSGYSDASSGQINRTDDPDDDHFGSKIGELYFVHRP